MKSYFINLFNYDIWANSLIQKSIVEEPILNLRIENLFSHLLSSQKIWLNRCNQESEKVELWDIKNNLKDMMEQNHKNWIIFLNNLEDEELENSITYSNTSGQTFQPILKDILTHLINHGSYHRGQIIQLLKEERKKLPYTDYIVWVREHFNN